MPTIISSRDDSIIRAVYTFRYLTAGQITRLFNYSPKSLKYVRDNLGDLAKGGYLHRFREPTTTFGVKPFIYRLGPKGMKYLKKEGFPYVSKHFIDNDEIIYVTLKHNLVLNDFLIAASLLPGLQPCLALYDLRHEWYLRHTPLSVKIRHAETEETVTVIPDGFLDFRFTVQGKIHALPVWVEIDQGSIPGKAFRKKIRGLIKAVFSEEYEKLFNTKAVTIAFATTAGEKRLTHIRKWIKQELEEAGKVSEGNLFLSTTLPTDEFIPKILFIEPGWYTPLDEQPVSLLDIT